MHSYLRAALAYFNFMRKQEEAEKVCGYGQKDNFHRYNTVYSPGEQLRVQSDRDAETNRM